MARDSSKAFSLLSSGMRRWVSKQGWQGFRDIQSQAIETLLEDPDHAPNLVISAATSSGKTEAAFMPALSMLQEYYEQNKEDRFCCMLYIAPLKALINDQHRRLTEMARDLNIPVYLWHGDAPQGQKNRMLKEHDGVIMITPESLESFLMNRGEWCSSYMTPKIMIVDEFHAFLGEGRGKQLLSLMSRIDMINKMAGKSPAIRIGLSATLSQLPLVASILSPDARCEVIDGTAAGSDEMDIQVLCFDPPRKREGQSGGVPKEDDVAIGREIIEQSVGEKTLTFATSRMQVETIASTINSICQAEKIPSEAFPHHGSLAKDIREELEHRLVSTDKPTMAIATVTLELGIDIGDIYKVFQVGSTNSVASLRQRVGRSGRRDGHKRVCCLVTSAKTPMEMEEELATTIVEIELMNAGWFEPPNAKRRDVSVLVSEILSVIKQYGSAYTHELCSLLVDQGAFRNVPHDLFELVVDDMLAAEFLEEDADGQLLLGQAGEREVDDWHFYAVFQSEDAFKVVSGQKAIGEITPPSTALLPLSLGGMFMLGGRYWQVIPPIDMRNRVIRVKQVQTKSKFLIPTSKGAGDVCGAVKRARIRLLAGEDDTFVPTYLDEKGCELLANARDFAEIHHLNKLGLSIYDAGEKGHETESEVIRRAAAGYTPDALVRVDPPVDTAALAALIKALEYAGMDPGGLANIPLWRLKELVDAVIADWGAIVANKENLIDNAMLEDIRNSEKYNPMLSGETLRYAYVDERIDLDGARKWLDAFCRFYDQVVA